MIIIDDNMPDLMPEFYVLCQESFLVQRVLCRIGENPWCGAFCIKKAAGDRN